MCVDFVTVENYTCSETCYNLFWQNPLRLFLSYCYYAYYYLTVLQAKAIGILSRHSVPFLASVVGPLQGISREARGGRVWRSAGEVDYSGD
jgi:hypothetical protein